MQITLNDVSQTIHRIKELKLKIERIEDDLSELKKLQAVLVEETIPGMFQELSLSSISIDAGEEVTVTQDVYVQLNPESKREAFAWLANNGFGGLIKTEVVTSFSRNERDKALAFSSLLAKKGYTTGFEESVHPQTMAAFMREQIRDQGKVPLDLFGARPVWKTKIKTAKKKK